VALKRVDFLALMRDNANITDVPAGFLPVVLLIAAGLLWRTAHSWNREMSLA